jgi:hypothetical protein
MITIEYREHRVGGVVETIVIPTNTPPIEMIQICLNFIRMYGVEP